MLCVGSVMQLAFFVAVLCIHGTCSQIQNSGARRSESKYGDSRCISDYNKHSVDAVSVVVRTAIGNIGGRCVFLCDGPGQENGHYPKIYRNVTLFLGIPYAKAPTKANNLRFKAPRALPSRELIQALDYQPVCPQSSDHFGIDKGVPYASEDCLYLNIFSPSVVRGLGPYAVMIYIHGGDWDHGNSNTFPAQMLATSQDVVVVTFNYRLGALGFLAAADNASAGNFGLLDQAMAIEWVMNHIDRFNGDPHRITLFGPGAGAASAGIHMLSTRFDRKIRGVIAQSGSAVADWAVIKDPTYMYNHTIEFARELRCDFHSTQRVVNCLRNKNVADFQTASVKPKVGWYQWGPVVDGHTREKKWQVLPESPEKLLDFPYSIFHPNFAYMSGLVKDEALSLFLEASKPNRYQGSKELLDKKIREFANIYNYTLDIEGLTEAVKFLYMPCKELVENKTALAESYINMMSDVLYNAPHTKMLKLLLRQNINAYAYVLNYTLEGMEKINKEKFGPFWRSVPHDTEYYLSTGAPFMDPRLYPRILNLDQVQWTEADRNMSQFFMTAWANFAKFGNPTPVPLFENITWHHIESDDIQYLSINTTNFTTVMMCCYRPKESQFWNSYFSSLVNVEPYWPPLVEAWEDKLFIYEASLWGALGATVLFLLLAILCCCLYARAKSKHIVSTEDIPDAVSTPTSIDTLLNIRRTEGRGKFLTEHLAMEQKHTRV